MNKSILKFGLLALLAVAMTGTPVMLRAQNATTNAPAKKPSRTIPFRGKLAAVDNSEKTITVGKETIQITSETRISKAGKPATFQDGAVGDEVAGSYKKDADGKLNALSLRFGPKVVANSGSNTNKP
jgi:hypothetical protein